MRQFQTVSTLFCSFKLNQVTLEVKIIWIKTNSSKTNCSWRQYIKFAK